MMLVGVGKQVISGFKQGAGMMGYGRHFHFVQGVETALHARAFVFEDPASGRKVGFVNAEICFVTLAVKRGVVEALARHHPALGIDEENLLISAQHTHSGPGGYSHYPLYNLTIPGFVPEVCNGIVEGIVAALVQAETAKQPAVLRHATGTFPPEVEVAFNRSLEAYNSNADVEPLRPEQWNLGVDRTMDLLRIDAAAGRPLGAITWFGVHATNLSNDKLDINWDNKGYAAHFMEERIRQDSGNPGFVAAFAQATAGDVTPNYVYDRKKRWTRGKFEDDLESARFNGRAQCDLALQIFAGAAPALPVELDAVLTYTDMSDVRADPELARGHTDAWTSPACVGVDMLIGTAEGPGMPLLIGWITKGIMAAVHFFERVRGRFMPPAWRERMRRKWAAQGPKSIIIEMGERRMMGTSNVGALVIPGFLDPGLATFKSQHRSGALGDKPWTPQVLPLQILIVGNLAITAIPGEMTTVAGRRLRATIGAELAKRGVRRVLLTTYANAYSGYVTTNEEYQHQRYEASHTVFGQWTLAAYQTKYQALARELCKAPEERDTTSASQPVIFTEDELALRRHEGPFAVNVRAARRIERQKRRMAETTPKH
jgi:neutral ceramidase